MSTPVSQEYLTMNSRKIWKFFSEAGSRSQSSASNFSNKQYFSTDDNSQRPKYRPYEWDKKTDINNYENLPPHDLSHTNILDLSNSCIAFFTSKGNNKSFPGIQIDKVDENVLVNGKKGVQYMSSPLKTRSYDPEIIKEDLKYKPELQDYVNDHEKVITDNVKKNGLDSKPTIVIKKKQPPNPPNDIE